MPGALGLGIHTQGDTMDDIRRNVRDTMDSHFEDDKVSLRLIRLHLVRKGDSRAVRLPHDA